MRLDCEVNRKNGLQLIDRIWFREERRVLYEQRFRPVGDRMARRVEDAKVRMPRHRRLREGESGLDLAPQLDVREQAVYVTFQNSQCLIRVAAESV
jgi:hypothetical protein